MDATASVKGRHCEARSAVAISLISGWIRDCFHPPQ